MKATPAYPAYHPRWYRKRVSTYWWLWQPSYLKFIVRELSSVPVAYSVVLTLLHLRAVTQGPAAYAALQEWLQTPLAIVLNGMSLGFVLFHTITWFNLTPRALVLRVHGKRVPDGLIIGANYVVWLVVSVVVAWLILRG